MAVSGSDVCVFRGGAGETGDTSDGTGTSGEAFSIDSCGGTTSGTINFVEHLGQLPRLPEWTSATRMTAEQSGQLNSMAIPAFIRQEDFGGRSRDFA